MEPHRHSRRTRSRLPSWKSATAPTDHGDGFSDGQRPDWHQKRQAGANCFEGLCIRWFSTSYGLFCVFSFASRTTLNSKKIGAIPSQRLDEETREYARNRLVPTIFRSTKIFKAVGGSLPYNNWSTIRHAALTAGAHPAASRGGTVIRGNCNAWVRGLDLSAGGASHVRHESRVRVPLLARPAVECDSRSQTQTRLWASA